MNTNTVDPEAPTTEPTDSRPEPRYSYDPGRTALRSPFEDRMLGGGAAGGGRACVAAGLARYFGVDTTIVRIAFVVLTIVGDAGIPLYLAGLLLIPDDGSDQSIAGSIIESLQNRNR